MKQYSIDRFEGKYAVCQDEEGVSIDVLKKLLPRISKSGDVVMYDEENDTYYIDEEKTQEIRRRIIALQDELFE